MDYQRIWPWAVLDVVSFPYIPREDFFVTDQRSNPYITPFKKRLELLMQTRLVSAIFLINFPVELGDIQVKNACSKERKHY